MAPSTDDIDALAQTDVRKAIPAEALLPILTYSPFIPSRSLINIRDMGAVPGSAVPEGRMYRCGTLEMAAADPDAVAWLGGHVRYIFDLRTPIEREKGPDPVVPGVENIWCDGQEGFPPPKLADFEADGGRPAWKADLMSVALVYRPIIKKVLEHVRDRPTEPFLVHCTAGRDRTGVIAGLLHHLAGTAPDVVVRDYMLSRIGTEPAREKLLQYAMATMGVKDVETPGFLNLISLKPEFWEAFIEGLQEQFGGWDGYVTTGLSISEEDLATMKKNLRA